MCEIIRPVNLRLILRFATHDDDDVWKRLKRVFGAIPHTSTRINIDIFIVAQTQLLRIEGRSFIALKRCIPQYSRVWLYIRLYENKKNDELWRCRQFFDTTTVTVIHPLLCRFKVHWIGKKVYQNAIRHNQMRINSNWMWETIKIECVNFD